MDIKQETSSPSIEILDLDVKSFNALKRAGINTIADIEAQTDQLGSTMPPRQWTSIINALNAYKGIPIPGSWVEEDMLGEELTFDKIADMVGETIIMDMSTESHTWYKAVMVEKIGACEGGGRRLMFYDGTKERGLVGEMFFNKDRIRPERAWRVKLQDKPTEPPAADFPTCSCPLWRSEAFKIVGDRKKSISFSCDACHSEDITDENTVSDIEHRCNDYLNCEYFLVHELEPMLKAENIKINVNTPLDRLKQLYETHCQQTVPTPAEHNATKTTAFDYSELDSGIAQSLRDCEAVIRQETAGYFTILGAKFKEAQDLLANHSSGTFERWYTSMGFKRQTVYNLIQRYEFSSSPTIGGREEAFENLSLTLSYDISKPDAPSELVNKVLDGDITTHKDYIALKKDYELAQQSNKSLQEANDHIFNASKKNYKMYDEERIKNYELEKQLAQVKKDLKELDEYRERNAELEQRDDELQRKNDVLELEKQELEQRIKEIENRPVDVAVQSDEEALAEKDQEISELKGEVERLSNKNVKVFAVRLTLDEYEKLVQIVCGGCRGGNDPVILEAVKKAQIIRL
ncbi:MAG: DNA-directed RNA polymerase subunit alpha C-terminal domain-containing protein [Oscillospiraceae bacterium]